MKLYDRAPKIFCVNIRVLLDSCVYGHKTCVLTRNTQSVIKQKITKPTQKKKKIRRTDAINKFFEILFFIYILKMRH